MTVTDPQNNDTVSVFDHGLSLGLSSSPYDVGPETSRKIYQGTATSTKVPLQSTVTTNNFILSPSVFGQGGPGSYAQSEPTLMQMALDGNAVNQTTPIIDQAFSAVGIMCYNTTSSPHCGYSTPVAYSLGLSQGTAILGADGTSRSTSTQYRWQTSPNAAAYFNANILDTPATITVLDSSANIAAQTTYNYDENNGSPQGYYGLPTSKVMINTGGTSPKWSTEYNSQGMPILKIDPKQVQTAFQNYLCGGLYPQTITAAYQSTTTVPETTTYTYDCNTGHITSFIDSNGISTTYQYSDPLGRMTSKKSAVSTSDKNWTIYSYPLPTKISIAQDENVKNDGLLKITLLSNGLGQVIQKADLSGAYTDTTYDSFGRVTSVSNPHLTVASLTDGVTSFTYDALGRKNLKCQPDNATSNNPCVPGASYKQWVYAGNIATFSDENRNSWSNTNDSLGRLIQVVEPGSLTTIYSYDALDNLHAVTQAGTAGDVSRMRSFTYDQLSRLITSQNSETNTICYGTWNSGVCQNGYDANENVLYKTDARGITTSYLYDDLNRVIQKMYPMAGSIPTIYGVTCYQYDALRDSQPGANLIGHLVAEWTQSGSSCAPNYTPSLALTGKVISSYSPAGRPLVSQQCVREMCQNTPFTQNQTYDLAGNMTYWTDGLGLNFNQQFDSANRVVSLAGGGSPPVVYFSTQQYNPAGVLQNWNIGGYLNFTEIYDTRLRPISETVTH